jgi:prepilin-type N-terminal cleavage/methylation domain-containing protein
MRKLNQTGFTLVELLVVMTVTTVLAGAGSSFIVSNLTRNTIATAKSNLLGEAQVGLDKVTNDVRSAANADVSNRWADANAPGGGQYGWSSTNTVLILATVAQDNNDNVLFQDASNYISYKDNVIYFVQNGVLYKRTLAAPVANNLAKTSCPAALATASCPADKALLHNVTAFSVRYIDRTGADTTATNEKAVELTITLQTTAYRNVITATYTTRMVFRNA